jgi:hypothetical protein
VPHIHRPIEQGDANLGVAQGLGPKFFQARQTDASQSPC